MNQENIESIATQVAKILKEQLNLNNGSLDTPMQKIMDDFINFKRSIVTPKQLSTIKKIINRVTDSLGMKTARDVNPIKIQQAIIGFSSLADSTKNTYLTTVKAMSRWAFEMGMIPFDMLSVMKPIPKKKVVIVRRRRAMGEDEIAQLLSFALLRQDKNGFMNYFSYLGFLYTGARLEELRKIRFMDITLEDDLIMIKPGKNGDARIIPIHPILRKFIAFNYKPRSPERVFQIPRSFLERFKKDLDIAGIKRIDKIAGMLDVHAMRQTFSTLIDEVEESKQAVRLAYDTLSHKFKKPMRQSWDKYVENGFKFMELEIVNRIMTEKPCKQSTKS